MKRRTLVLAGAAALAAIPAGWYYGSPWWTLWRMREAAQAGDVARLAAYVDYPAIRGQAAAEFRAFWASALTAVRSDTPQGRRLRALARRKLADPAAASSMPDLRPWLASIPIRVAGLGGGGADGYRPYVVHRGLDTFELREEGASLENGPVLTFRRHGLSWKLAAVRWGQQ